jgi:hypothetical protein
MNRRNLLKLLIMSPALPSALIMGWGENQVHHPACGCGQCLYEASEHWKSEVKPSLWQEEINQVLDEFFRRSGAKIGRMEAKAFYGKVEELRICRCGTFVSPRESFFATDTGGLHD